MLHYTRLEGLARSKHTSLFGPFKSYKENEVLSIGLLATSYFSVVPETSPMFFYRCTYVPGGVV